MSYARADKAHAARIVAALERAGHEVWWDDLFEGGALFATKIEAALRGCDVVVVAWSRQAVTSDWVRDEAAVGRDRKRLVPVSLDGSQPPLGFGQYHAVDLSRWRGDVAAAEFQAVVRGIATVAGQAMSPSPRPAAPGAGMRAAVWSRRRALGASVGVAALGAVAVVAWRGGMFAGAGAAANTVAVLPFVNLSGDRNQDYFADGIAEEVRATLARQPAFRVTAQMSSGVFRQKVADAITIAGTLGVAFLLAGSVRRSGDVMRITADLVDGRTGFSRWAQTFDRPSGDIFAVQAQIANAVLHALAAQLAAPSGGPSVTAVAPARVIGSTTSLVAYDAYLRGRALYERSEDQASERAALAQFDAALAADPNFAAAHAARARSLTTIANQFGEIARARDTYDAAVAAARRAIALAPDLADAHSTLGVVLFQGRFDARAARVPFDRSRELGPGDAAVLGRFAMFAARTGRHTDAAVAMRESMALDPLNPLGHLDAGLVEYAARRYAASLVPLRLALAESPRLARVHAALGDSLLQRGELRQSLAAYAAEPLADLRLTGVAIVQWRLGNRPAARTALAELVTRGDQVLYQQAQVFAQWGDLPAALARLQRARSVGDSGVTYANSDPLLDPLRSDARFTALLRGLGFTV